MKCNTGLKWVKWVLKEKIQNKLAVVIKNKKKLTRDHQLFPQNYKNEFCGVYQRLTQTYYPVHEGQLHERLPMIPVHCLLSPNTTKSFSKLLLSISKKSHQLLRFLKSASKTT